MAGAEVGRIGVEPDPVVRHLDHELAVLLGQANGDVLGASVADRVVEGLVRLSAALPGRSRRRRR